MAEEPKTLEEKQEYAFSVFLGGYLMAKEHDAEGNVRIDDIDSHLARLAFVAGWGWGALWATEKIETAVSE